MDDQPVPSDAGRQRITGWPKVSQFERPRDALWPLASMASLRVSSLVAQRVAEEPIVVLTDRSDFSFVRSGIVRAAGRTAIYDLAYPDAADGGELAGWQLSKLITDPKNALLVVTVEVSVCARAFERYLRELVDLGLKVVGLVRLEKRDLENCRAFSSEWLGQFDIPVIELFPAGEYPEDVSAMIDVLLLEFDGMYGTRVRLSPEERENIVVNVSVENAPALIPLLERIVISRKTGDFIPQPV